MEFKAWKKIERFSGINISISEKINGTNAIICIYKNEETGNMEIKAGSRTRWLSVESDNYGFCSFVMGKKDELINFLGEGYHYGEWYGSGISSGYGLKEKRLALFNTGRWKQEIEINGKTLPERIDLVPVLYHGEFTKEIIQYICDKLKKDGSVLISGFMAPEGIVLQYNDSYKKIVFDPEEVAWRKGSGGNKEKQEIRKKSIEELYEYVGEYLQPIRLSKLFLRDELYKTQFPSSLPKIVNDYILDLESESIVEEVKKPSLKKALFPWVKLMVEKIE